MPNIRKHEFPEDRSINMTPMIDVVFQLILFFMLTSSMNKANRIELDLPESTSKAKTRDEKSLEVSYRQLAGRDEIRLNGQAVEGLDRLPSAMRAIASPTDNPLVDLQIERGAQFQKAVNVMDAVRDAGFVKFSINTIAPGRSSRR